MFYVLLLRLGCDRAVAITVTALRKDFFFPRALDEESWLCSVSRLPNPAPEPIANLHFEPLAPEPVENLLLPLAPEPFENLHFDSPAPEPIENEHFETPAPEPIETLSTFRDPRP